LKRGSLAQLLGPKVWWRGFKAGVLAGHGLGNPSPTLRKCPVCFYSNTASSRAGSGIKAPPTGRIT
jgi:hypothetical protein